MINRLRARMQTNGTVLGCMLMVPSPALVEVIGYAGLDVVVIDAEHGPYTTEAIENQIRAAHLTGMSALVRPVAMTAHDILKALDAGADGLVVPHVTTASEARAVVAAAYFPPLGKRGLSGATRAARHGFIPTLDYIAKAAEAVTVFVQIEDKEALPNLVEIANVEGIDGLFFGPADMASSMGHLDDPSHPEILQAADAIVAAAKGAGKLTATVARDVAHAKELRGRGFDIPMMSAAGLIGQAFRRVAEDAKS